MIQTVIVTNHVQHILDFFDIVPAIHIAADIWACFRIPAFHRTAQGAGSDALGAADEQRPRQGKGDRES